MSRRLISSYHKVMVWDEAVLTLQHSVLVPTVSLTNKIPLLERCHVHPPEISLAKFKSPYKLKYKNVKIINLTQI